MRDFADEAGTEARQGVGRGPIDSGPLVSRLDASGCFSEVDPSYALLLGHEPTQLLRTTWRAMIHPADQPQGLLAHTRLLSSGRAQLECRVLRADKSHFYTQFLLAASTDIDGRVTGYFLIARDITQRRRAQELCESRERLSSFAAQLDLATEMARAEVARYCRDALTVVLQEVDAGLATLNGRVSSSVAAADTSVRESLSSMAQRILTARASLERALNSLRRSTSEEFDLRTALEERCREYEARCAIQCAADIDLSTQVSRACANALYRFFDEAVTDAVERGGADQISVRLRAENTTILLEVQDNGQGLRESEVRSSHTSGLLAMRERARALGGTLTIQAQSATGIRVRLQLPLTADPNQGRVAGHKLLVVDANPIERKGIGQLLAEVFPDATVEESDALHGAKERICAKEYDAVLLDMSVLEDGAAQHVAEIKRIRPQLPVLLMGAQREELFTVAVLRSGASAFLLKERLCDELAEAMTAALEGERYLCADISNKLAFDLVNGSGRAPHERLSAREFEVMRFLARGKTVSEIATVMCKSRKTITTYRARLLEKMSAKTNAELVQYCTRHNLLDTK